MAQEAVRNDVPDARFQAVIEHLTHLMAQLRDSLVFIAYPPPNTQPPASGSRLPTPIRVGGRRGRSLLRGV